MYEVKNDILYKDGKQVSTKESPCHGGEIKALETIVIHYDGTDNLGGLQWLTAKESKVSAHFWIAKSGVIWQLLPCNVVGWHAGRGEWNGHVDCLNSYSLGIENQGLGNGPWPEAQMQTLIATLIALHRAYPSIQDVIGHEDYAPGRKPDPGKFFDWDRVYKELSDAGYKYE